METQIDVGERQEYKHTHGSKQGNSLWLLIHWSGQPLDVSKAMLYRTPHNNKGKGNPVGSPPPPRNRSYQTDLSNQKQRKK